MIIKNEKGLVGIFMVLIVAVIIGAMIIATQDRMRNLAAQYSHFKALLDAEFAVEKFGAELKGAYDKANTYSDFLVQTDDSLCTEYSLTSPNGSEVKLCWNFPPEGLCYERGLGAPPICLFNSEDSFALNNTKNRELKIYVKSETKIPLQDLLAESVLQAAREFWPQKAFAQEDVSDLAPYRPTPPWSSEYAFDPTENELELNSGSTCTSTEVPTADCMLSRSYPREFTCGSPNVDCIRVQFCVLHGGICTDDEFIKQTYVFFKNPDQSINE
jgi:hypothetical protein